jgi:hypothetical protein
LLLKVGLLARLRCAWGLMVPRLGVGEGCKVRGLEVSGGLIRVF